MRERTHAEDEAAFVDIKPRRMIRRGLVGLGPLWRDSDEEEKARYLLLEEREVLRPADLGNKRHALGAGHAPQRWQHRLGQVRMVHRDWVVLVDTNLASGTRTAADRFGQ